MLWNSGSLAKSRLKLAELVEQFTAIVEAIGRQVEPKVAQQLAGAAGDERGVAGADRAGRGQIAAGRCRASRRSGPLAGRGRRWSASTSSGCVAPTTRE